MTITEFILLFIFLWLAVSLIAFSVKRIRLLSMVMRLKKINGVSVEITSLPAFIAPRPTKAPAARITIRDKTYSVRIFNGRGALYAAHIANEKYAAVFLKSAGARKVRFFGRRNVAITQMKSTVYFAKTVIMPDRPKSCDIPVMIFNPAPRELTYVTPEKNSIRVAFTGDTVNGEMVFTAGTFARYIDRDSRGFFDKIKHTNRTD